MIYVEDELIKLNGVVLPGLVKSIEVIETAKVDEQEVEGSATKPKQATGYEDAKVNIELIIDDTPSQTKYQRYATLRAIFRSPGQSVPQPIPIISEDTAAHGVEKVIFKKAVPQGRKQARAAYGYAGAVGVHPADHHGKVRLQFRLQFQLRQVRRRRGEQSEGRLQELPEQRTG
mgnify:CR=1 FL=1|jgi:hypothetical protein